MHFHKHLSQCIISTDICMAVSVLCDCPSWGLGGKVNRKLSGFDQFLLTLSDDFSFTAFLPAFVHLSRLWNMLAHSPSGFMGTFHGSQAPSPASRPASPVSVKGQPVFSQVEPGFTHTDLSGPSWLWIQPKQFSARGWFFLARATVSSLWQKRSVEMKVRNDYMTDFV